MVPRTETRRRRRARAALGLISKRGVRRRWRRWNIARKSSLLFEFGAAAATLGQKMHAGPDGTESIK